ncbi:hypothetical protein AHMF7616_01957 [Adhaeribacter pallidiroseus]|uniref:DUF2281 domain-containing protein n=2 Tax=Adhaeribacter pallidiroseus TaxID=2072847 RepID=A0A369QF66_9BACT|nr:hypothetical protein AHMF7616_01957 [Adhaeribacter pallidiroseus]
MDNITLYSKLAILPDHLKSEVSDFIDFLAIKEKNKHRKKPVFGSGQGMFVMKPSFDEPLDDFKEYMP